MEKVSIEFNESESESKKVAVPSGFLEKLAFILLLPLPFLLPLFFIPSASFPFQFSKMLLLSLCVLLTFSIWVIARLKDGKFVFPNTPLLLVGGLTFLVAIISALFSGGFQMAFLGQVLDVGTVASIGIMFLLMFLVPLFFQSKDRIFYAYTLFFGGFFLIAAFHILRLIFGADFMAWGIFTDITSNVVGGWNDLSIFFGIGTVLSLVTLELISLSRLFKVLAYLALALSLFFIAIINFTPVWYVVALFSLVFLVYIISFDKSEAFSQIGEAEDTRTVVRKVPLASLAVLLISLVFILGGNMIGTAIATKLNISRIEARPSWVATFSIAQSVLAKDPFLGSGPNRFSENWAMYKPDGINGTVFWNTDFNFGIGLIPTFLVTTGLLGAITWVAFLALFLYTGFKAILSSIGDKISRYLISSSFLVSLFLWIINIFYIPGFSMVAFTFFFTGLFIASMYQNNLIKPKVISFVEDPKKGFVSVLILILLLIGSISIGYAFVEKFIAAVYFQRGLVAYNTLGDINKAEGYIAKAVTLDDSAPFYRSLTQIDMLRMSSLLSQNPKDISADTVRTEFQALLSAALNHVQKAVALEPNDYKNWFALGQVYEALVPLKIPNVNAYDSAHTAYNQALKFNPKSPAILLTLGRLEVANGNNAKARDYISQALQQKNNYTDAIFLLAQVQVQEGNIKDAIDSVQAASILAPNDSGIFFQLGLLRYNYKDYQGAAGALERAITLNPAYANAKYFLGLSYQKLGRMEEAIKQFKDLQISNPDNKEVSLILSNLQSGRDPFANAAPPIDNKPEKRSTPPVPEKGSTQKKTSASTDASL